MTNRIAAIMQKPVAELSETEKQLARQNIMQAGTIIQLKSKIHELQGWMFSNQN
jgi:hypothetical protein